MSHPVDSPRWHSHPAEDMDCYRVSKLANNARNDSPDCITAVQKPLFWTAVMRINYGLTPLIAYPFNHNVFEQITNLLGFFGILIV
jgi:hypothetical protein